MDEIIAYKYEALIKYIYKIPSNSTTFHFTHGAHADIMRHLLNYAWVESGQERVEFEDAVNFGKSLGEVCVYLQEALQYAIDNNNLSETKKECLTKVYNSLPADTIELVVSAINSSCEILDIK